ncbi:hypothetical protein I314_06345 [Cryptococcus bacillisporus CA1873]|uniref:Diphthamide synthase domain-containing protein n=1 Tax=Cryptococcus bacillisporus CA1873 TaxID=1296111 RepID=A0ABR5B2M8_CRYGA|nr:hypothetical protein I314_06345 [Cryptococcus bacillisporus CA1873]|eukprot:KIR57840.1 hypothetical protein I314_06345 [Cryptococcus gattii CA1873]
MVPSPFGASTGQIGDETEDLTDSLSRVLDAPPEATALSAVGLGENVVGKQLGQIRPLLAKLESQYGSHPAGEGGEYETLTLSTPLFSHRLKLAKTKRIVTDPELYTVTNLKVVEAVSEPKKGWVTPTVEELREMLGLEEEQFVKEDLWVPILTILIAILFARPSSETSIKQTEAKLLRPRLGNRQFRELRFLQTNIHTIFLNFHTQRPPPHFYPPHTFLAFRSIHQTTIRLPSHVVLLLSP